MDEEWPKVRSRQTITLSPWVDIVAREIEFSPQQPTQIYHAVAQLECPQLAGGAPLVAFGPILCAR